MAIYINPYTDFGFKKLFGEEGNKDLLIDFLNALLPPHHQIADLTFQNVEAVSDTSDERKAFFDIHCKAVSGERFIVEMQKAKVKYFIDRSLYYVTYPIREQAQRGDWNFQLSAIYFIAVLDFWYENEKTAKFLRTITLKDQFNEPFYDKLQLTYLQMKAFNKEPEELETQLDKWAYFLKNLESFEGIPQILNMPVFARAFNTAKLANLNPQQLQDYETSRLQYIGAKEIANTAAEDARKEERAKAEAEKKEMKAKAEAEKKEMKAKAEAEKKEMKAKAEAEKKEMKDKAEAEKKEMKDKAEAEKKEMILEMYTDGMSIKQIAKFAKITEEQIQQIIAKHTDKK